MANSTICAVFGYACALTISTRCPHQRTPHGASVHETGVDADIY